MSERITRKDVYGIIDNLNERYYFDDTTEFKFDLLCAYGGCQIVLRNNKNHSCCDITTGFLSSRECIDNFYLQLRKYGWGWIDSIIYAFSR